MEISRFSMSEISIINNLREPNKFNNKNDECKRKISVPTEESFEYVFFNAKAGNEMSAVQIDEWNRFCKPVNTGEKKVLNMVKKAAGEIFK